MGSFECLTPYRGEKGAPPLGRCGRCKNCMERRRVEWANRMMLEQYGKKYRPLFVTCTYAPEHLPKNSAECVTYCQKWLKRLRRQTGKIRYWLCTEKGDKKGRLHQHAIIWAPEIAHLTILEQWRIFWKTWNYQRIEVQYLRSAAGFYYVAKYITKNLTSENYEDSVYSRTEGCYVNKGKLYTYSQQPMLGCPGMERWEHLAARFNRKYPNVLPPNYFQAPILGKIQTLYIPSDAYKRFCKEQLKLSFTDAKEYTGRKADITPEEVDELIEQWQKDIQKEEGDQ